MLQVFSQSVANSLRFYKRFVPELRKSEETAKFCEWINQLFDALNIMKTNEALTVNSSQYKVFCFFYSVI